MRAKLRFLALCVALAAGSLPAAAEDLLLEGATVHTVSGETLNGAPVLVANGKIVAVGGKIELTAGVRRVDLSGLHLYPGMIAATTSLGLTEINAVRATQDTTEVGEVTPDVRAWIAVNPDSELIPVARANGVTHALVLPLGGTVSGQSGLIALAGWTTEQMTVKAPVALHLFWPSMGLDLRPKEEWKGKAEWKSPEKQAEERRARLKELDDLFDAAAAYAKARAAAGAAAGAAAAPGGPRVGIADDRVNPAWEALLPLLRGEVPLLVHADEIRQIEAAVAWAERRKLAMILAGGRDAWRIAPRLAAAKVPVIYEATFERPVRDVDPYDAQFRGAEVLRAAGVLVAFSPGAGSWPAAEIRNLPYHAAQARAFGMPAEEALRAITLYPARMLRVEDRLGSIEPGKEASLIATDGDLLDIRSHVVRMWIAGRETDLESRHTRLHGKYDGRPGKE